MTSERRRVPLHVQRHEDAAGARARRGPGSDSLVPVSIDALGPTPEFDASNLDRILLHIAGLLAEHMERSGEVTVLGCHAVDADLRDTSVGVEGGHSGALLRGGEAVQPA